MKRFSIIVITSLMLTLLSACGENNKGIAIKLNEIINNRKENAITSVSYEIIKTSNDVKKNRVVLFFQDIYANSQEKDILSQSISENDIKDSYVGEYNSCDMDEPDLEIQRNANGTYKIQIGMYRLAFFHKCIGVRTKNGIIFLVNWGNRDYRGIITLKDDVATVTFTSYDWIKSHHLKEYKYYKTSNIPNIYVP